MPYSPAQGYRQLSNKNLYVIYKRGVVLLLFKTASPSTPTSSQSALYADTNSVYRYLCKASGINRTLFKNKQQTTKTLSTHRKPNEPPTPGSLVKTTQTSEKPIC